MRTRQTKAAGVLRPVGVGLAPALRTRQIEHAEKRPAARTAPTTGPGGVALKLSGVGADDIVIALQVGGELGTVSQWLERNGHTADRAAGLRKLFAMHRAGHVGFRDRGTADG